MPSYFCSSSLIYHIFVNLSRYKSIVLIHIAESLRVPKSVSERPIDRSKRPTDRSEKPTDRSETPRDRSKNLRDKTEAERQIREPNRQIKKVSETNQRDQ